eukprot:14026186-Heterocapsa_arctica.AAC.1
MNIAGARETNTPPERKMLGQWNSSQTPQRAGRGRSGRRSASPEHAASSCFSRTPASHHTIALII